jgi:hypothetical protein
MQSPANGHTVLQDKYGNWSSKRVIAMSCVCSGVLMTWIVFIISVFKPIGDPTTAIKIIELLLGSGTVSVIATLGEGIFDAKH